MWFTIKWQCCVFLCCFPLSIADPYKTLGLKPDATIPQVKKAYKDLARKWHPDKNDSPDAPNVFLQMTEAYKLLSDAEKKHRYDTTGQTEPPRGYGPTGGEFRKFSSFDHMFSTFEESFHRFTFHKESFNSYMKRSITQRVYQNSIVPNSKYRPYILLFVSEMCLLCDKIEPMWSRLVEELEPFHFALNTVDAVQENALSKKLGISNVPHLVFVLDGQPYHYTEHTINIGSTLAFIKSKFPRNLVRKVDEGNIEEFLSGWNDNKIRVLLFGRLDIIRLRYISLSWKFRERAVIGYVQLGKPETDVIRSRYGVSASVDSLLIFLEDVYSSPVASVSMKDLPYHTMNDLIEANKFLTLPRLSSQEVLDALCPVESLHALRRLCVVLVTQDSEEHDENRDALRQYVVQSKPIDKDKITYTYIYREKQSDFVNAITASPGAPYSSDLHVVIIWRNEEKHVRYEWLEDKWINEEDNFNKSKDMLRNAVNKLMYNSDAMPYETEIKDLFDENAQNIVWRILNKLSSFHDYVTDHFTFEDFITYISIIASILFIMLGAYVMKYLVKLEEEKVGRMNNGLKKETVNKSPQLRIHELRGETYNGLVRLLKPGCRTLVLICDSETKPKLIKMFHKSCWPYRKNKTLMFSFLNIERSSAMEWYKRILILGLTEPRELNINPKNTIGTVLSLNGHRKYYCIYHAKHPEDVRLSHQASGHSDIRNRAPRYGESGNFMGFSDSDSSAESDAELGNKKKATSSCDKPLLNYYSNILFEEQLLEGFSNWLDRLFEGMTHRYHINYWPDWVGK